jgi:hypothetical protein
MTATPSGFELRAQILGGLPTTESARDDVALEFSSSILGTCKLKIDLDGFRRDDSVDRAIFFNSAFTDDPTGEANLTTEMGLALAKLTGAAGQQLYSITSEAWSTNLQKWNLTSSVTGSDKSFGYLTTTGTGIFYSLSNVTGGVTHIPTQYYSDYFNVKSTEQKTFDGNIRQKTIITSRFSAPGGPEVQTESFLDVYAKEFSVHNAIPFRNLLVKNDSGEKAKYLDRKSKALHSSDESVNGTLVNTRLGNSNNGGDFAQFSINLAFWVKLDEGVSQTTDRIVMSGGSSDGWTNVRFKNKTIYFSVEDSSSRYRYWFHTFSESDFNAFHSWAHVVITWDEVWNVHGSTKLFVNGELVGDMVGISIGSPNGTHDALNEIYFFHSKYSPVSSNSIRPTGCLHGALCEFGWWSGANGNILDQTDVTALYNTGKYKDQTTVTAADTDCALRAYWHFGEYDTIFNNIEIGAANLNYFGLYDNVANYKLECTSLANFSLVNGPFTITAATLAGIDTIRINSHANRTEGLNTLHQRATGRSGVDSKHGTTDESDFLSPVAGGQYEASYHKVHRNTLVAPRLSGSTDVIKIVERKNNFYYQSHLPASDYNYSWVTSSLGNNYSVRSGKQKVFGYWPKDGMLMINAVTGTTGHYKDQIVSATHVSAINFPTASQILGS